VTQSPRPSRQHVSSSRWSGLSSSRHSSRKAITRDRVRASYPGRAECAKKRQNVAFATFPDRTVEPNLSRVDTKVPAVFCWGHSREQLARCLRGPNSETRASEVAALCVANSLVFCLEAPSVGCSLADLTQHQGAEHLLVPAAHNLVLISLARLLLPNGSVRKHESMGVDGGNGVSQWKGLS
jgi:hypothetical protein